MKRETKTPKQTEGATLITTDNILFMRKKPYAYQKTAFDFVCRLFGVTSDSKLSSGAALFLEMGLIGVKWKKQKDVYEAEHSAELILWNTANRFLHAKGISPTDLPEKIVGWQAELNTLSEAHDLEYSNLKQYREKVKELDTIHRQVTKALAPEPEQLGRKKQNMEI